MHAPDVAPTPASGLPSAHAPYSGFLAAACLSCAAYAVQVHHHPPATGRPLPAAPDASPTLFRKTAS